MDLGLEPKLNTSNGYTGLTMKWSQRQPRQVSKSDTDFVGHATETDDEPGTSQRSKKDKAKAIKSEKPPGSINLEVFSWKKHRLITG